MTQFLILLSVVLFSGFANAADIKAYCKTQELISPKSCKTTTTKQTFQSVWDNQFKGGYGDIAAVSDSNISFSVYVDASNLKANITENVSGVLRSSTASIVVKSADDFVRVAYDLTGPMGPGECNYKFYEMFCYLKP